MAKTETTVKGYVYTVTSPNGGTVTDAEGKLNKPVDAGDQVTVTAPSDTLTCDDDDAVICKANFKSPLLALRLLGQGGTALPAGYTRAEFLESSGTQYIDTGVELNNASVVKSRFRVLSGHKMGFIFCARYAANVRAFCIYLDSSYTWLNYGTASDTKSYPLLSKNIDYDFKAEANNWTFNGTTCTLPAASAFNAGKCFIFNLNANGSADTRYFVGRFYSFAITNGGNKHKFVPAIAPDGKPCMLDLETSKPCKNAGSGHFVVGMTFAQASKLGRTLPASGGDLYISLPAGWEQNSLVRASLSLAAVRMWNIYPRTTAAAASTSTTYALRRIWVRRVADPLGTYVADDGSRWRVEWCEEVFGADPETLGFERFRSVDAAVEYWGLAPYVDTNAEELTTEFE